MLKTDADYQLNQSEIADAVNRSGWGNEQRERRELMRLGTDDPEAFKSKYSDFLIEPFESTQPDQNITSDTLATQNPQGSAASGGGYSYFDYNNPTSGYSINDLGRGAYDILGVDGSNLGRGYKSLQDTIKELQSDYTKNYNDLAPYRQVGLRTGDVLGEGDTFNSWYGPLQYDYKQTQTTDPYGYVWDDVDETGNPIRDYSYQGTGPAPELPAQFAGQSYEDVMSKYLTDPTNMATEYNSDFQDTGGDLGKWEIIGNLLQGQPITSVGAEGGRGFLGDAETETLRGLETLFGSTPMLKDGSLAGYSMNLGPATPDLAGYMDPFSVRKQDLGGDTMSDSYLQREFNDLDTWKSLVKKINPDPQDYNMFVGKDDAANLPGWNNKSGYNYQSKDKGLFGNDILNSILPLVVGAFAPPVGAALGGLNSLAQTGTGFGALSAGLGASGAFNSLGPALGTTSQIGNQIGSAGLNTVFDTIQGKDFDLNKVGAGLAGSFAGSTLGDALQGLTGSQTAGNISNAAANQLVRTGLFNVLSKRRN